jgi:ankyrin repeat protein
MKLDIVLAAFVAGLHLFAAEPAPPGSTPLHRAALRGDAESVAALIGSGADVNATNNAGATPLHYGVGSDRIVDLLLKAGANPNACSIAGNTPLHSAAARPDAFNQVKQLLDAGAQVDAVRPPASPGDNPQTPLSLAAYQAEERTVRLLLDRGAAPGLSNSIAVANAAFAGRKQVLEWLVDRGGSVNCSDGFAGHALNIALYAQHRHLAPYLLEKGADLHQKSHFGEPVPPIVWSAYSETADLDVTRALLGRGVDVNEPSDAGSTALSWAQKRGQTALVALLQSKGAAPGPVNSNRKAVSRNAVPSDAASRERMLKVSAQRAVDLLQRSSDGFLENGFVKKSACVSCHQQTLPAVAFARARERGFQLNEAALARQLAAQQTGWSKTRDQAYEMHAPQPAPAAVIGYGLHGLHALGYKPDELTAAMAWYLAETQLPDGSWPDYDVRPPMEEGQVVGTALTLKALQYYPPAFETRPIHERIAKARRWLEQFQPQDLSQRVFRYHGLGWAGASQSELESETRELLALQRSDGGWAALPGLESDAWATGHTLVALHEVGGFAANGAAYQRGVEFLLRTQFEDGSWLVKSRTWPFQPHFDSGFPHGKDQWISAGGTAWAVIALLNTLQPVTSAESIPSAQALIARYSQSVSALPNPGGEMTKASVLTTADARFVREIIPIFEKSCLACHSGDKPKGGLDLRNLSSLIQGGQSGQPAIIPGQPDASPLLHFVQDQVEDLEMPPLSRRAKYPALSKREVETLRDWIGQQAVFTAKP